MNRTANVLVALLFSFLSLSCTTTVVPLSNSITCLQSWSEFDCARMQLSSDADHILDHDELGPGRAQWYETTIKAEADVVGLWHAAKAGDTAEIDRNLDDFVNRVNNSDVPQSGKDELLRQVPRVRELAKAAAQQQGR